MALCAALLEAASRGHAEQLLRLLRAPSADINTVDENGCSLLQRAAADGHVEVVDLLLKQGADPNKQDIVYGNTAAHEAAWKGYSRCVALLAAAHANLHIRNFGGFAPLHLACQNGHNQSCREILLAGAHPDIQNNYGDTSLHTSARYGHAGVTRILISAECRIAEQNKNGDTALHIAAAMGRRKLTRILLEAGCDKSLKNKQGETARDIATRKDLNEIIQILNTPASKPKKDKKKDKQRDKSKERSLDERDGDKKKSDRDKTPDKKEKKKTKTVTFENQKPQWSPYGCHYYPDPKFFPKPKLDSLPQEPLKKGEQYYLDLAGNIRKGPIGVGYTCYCAPFFKHMEEKLNEDKKELKRHIDKAHDRLDQKVSHLEEKTQGQITELTRFVAAERTLCKERHLHLEQWLTRGMMFRASERVKRLDYSPRGSLDIPPLKRTRSLEILDSKEWRTVNKIIKSFNKNVENYETKDLENSSKKNSKSSDMLDVDSRVTYQDRSLKSSQSADVLDACLRDDECSIRSPGCRMVNVSSNSSRHMNEDLNVQNVTAEIHVKSNNISVSQSPLSVQAKDYPERYRTPSRQSRTKSPSSSYGKNSDSKHDIESDVKLEGNHILNGLIHQKPPMWKSQVLQRTADDIRKRVQLEKELANIIPKNNARLDISQDGYVKIPKHDYQTDNVQTPNVQPRKSVQELAAKIEQQAHREICNSPEPQPMPRTALNPTVQSEQISFKTTSPLVTQQPLRPAPVLKEPVQKNKRFSLHNLIPFPTRKTFQHTSKDTGNNSESSDEDDSPIRSQNEPGPMKNTNLLKTLPLPNYENMAHQNIPQHQIHTHSKPPYPQASRVPIPKDAYFHDIPNRPRYHHQVYSDETVIPNCSNSLECANETGLPPQNVNIGRNRNPMYHPTGLLDAMMQDHIVREMERIPHCYQHLDQNTEIEIANHDERNGYFDGNTGLPVYPPHVGIPHGLPVHGALANGIPGIRKPLQADHNLLHSRLQSLAINTNLTETQSQIDRESHNDSGYSTKVYGSSQGPSPSLSGNVECDALASGRMSVMGNGKANGPRQSHRGQIGTSSLV